VPRPRERPGEHVVPIDRGPLLLRRAAQVRAFARAGCGGRR
jgi:hypothetical protein